MANSLPTGTNFLVITSAWSLFEAGISEYNAQTLASTNPVFSMTEEMAPVSTLMGDGMYMTVIPFQVTSSLSTFTFLIDNLHMPYNYDLPNYYIYVLTESSNDEMASSNEFEMTNADIFYETNLKSLVISCEDNYLGVKNTICEITFGTQNPFKADGSLTVVFSGINIATDDC